MREGVVDVGGGRRVGYARHGLESGIPLLEFHGVPGSRAYDLDAGALEAAGVTLYTLERPGFGLSDPSPGRTLLDWPHDVAAVADALGLDRFAVLGVSMGGPSAVACGYVLPDRVAMVGLVASVGPVFDQPQFDALLSPELQLLLPVARDNRDVALGLVREFLAPTADAVAADPSAFFDGPFLDGWTEGDRPLFVTRRDFWIDCLTATWGRGVETMVDESGATYGPWGFEPADLRVPVRAWHGDEDAIPSAVVQFVVDSVSDGRMTIHPGEGHVLAKAHHADWLTTLAAWSV